LSSFGFAPANEGMIDMQKLVDLEKSIAILLERHRALKHDNQQLQLEKQGWLEEKQRMLQQIDRILADLDDIDVEEL
jgi:hypothetical protein